MKLIFIVPSYNASSNILKLSSSLMSQSDDRWHAVIIDDISSDNSWEVMKQLPEDKFTIVKNKTKKYALRNIVETSRKYENDDDIIIATLDGDDQLCNDSTVSLVLNAYENGADVAWTGHRWDINDINISANMPSSVDPYGWRWVSSHLRTFRATMISKIDDKNFKGINENWFERGYDQALMLPILYLTQNRTYIDEICYLYNIDSDSIPHEERDWCETQQISTINFVRARGFINK